MPDVMMIKGKATVIMCFEDLEEPVVEHLGHEVWEYIHSYAGNIEDLENKIQELEDEIEELTNKDENEED